MTDKETQTLVELTAIKAAKATVVEFEPKFELIANKVVEASVAELRLERKRDIELHKAQCQAGKFKAIKSLTFAGIGGGIVVGLRAVIDWVVK